MQRTSITQNLLQLEAKEAVRLKAEEKLDKAERKMENLNKQN